MTFSNQSFAETLKKGFEYDYWANMRWYAAVQLMKKQDTATPVLQHILSTQRIWLERCGVPVDAIPRIATRAAFQSASEAWQQVVTTRPLDQRLAYQDSRGHEHERELGEIAWHIINHGTFHRGHLRGLAQSEGFDEFADTDMIYYFDEARKK